MADFWTTPKIDWVTNNGIGFEDLNRGEANTSAVRDATKLKLQGFGYTVDNTPDDALMTILSGSGYSSDGIPIHMASSISKNLNPFVQGTGVGGMAPGAPAAIDNTWYYIFVIMDPTDGSTDIMIDDNAAGTNVISGTFTVKRRINSIKSASIAVGDLKLVEMHSTGDKVFINPNSMYDNRHIEYTNTDNGNYTTRTLKPAAGEKFALPALEVLAKFNVRSEGLNAVGSGVGFISKFLNLYTIPTLVFDSPDWNAEILITAAEGTGLNVGNTFDIMVDTTRTFALGILGTLGVGSVFVAVVGYTDERLA